MRSGIYAIVNILNFKYYIGSASDFKKRWAVHVSEYVHSEETKAKLSKTMTGRKHSEETKVKMRAKVMSEEARLKISIAQKARWCKLK